MENASKALIMAGAILIGVLLLSLMVYFFSSASGLRSSYTATINNQRVNEFNAEFVKYDIRKNSYNPESNYVTIRNIVTLANYAYEFNKTVDEKDHISIIVNGKRIEDNTQSEKNSLLKNNMLNQYVSNGVIYDGETGRIKEMSFSVQKKSE